MEPISNKKRIVVVGAGPAGLLAAIFLCRRKQSNNNVYEVTLVDPGVDYSTLDDLSAVRSWMIGLSAHGLQAVKQIPGLYEDYIEGLGVTIKRATVVIGSRLTTEGTPRARQTDRWLPVQNQVCGTPVPYP